MEAIEASRKLGLREPSEMRLPKSEFRTRCQSVSSRLRIFASLRLPFLIPRIQFKKKRYGHLRTIISLVVERTGVEHVPKVQAIFSEDTGACLKNDLVNRYIGKMRAFPKLGIGSLGHEDYVLA